MNNLISTNLSNFINTFEFRLNLFAHGDRFVTVDLDLTGVSMLLREVDVKRTHGKRTEAESLGTTEFLNSVEHELLELKTRFEAEKALADGGKNLSDENALLMSHANRKVQDIQAELRKDAGLFS